jgi:hypothetical protein
MGFIEKLKKIIGVFVCIILMVLSFALFALLIVMKKKED